MSQHNRLDDLEHWNSYGGLYFWEHPELWVRRSPMFYGSLAVAAVLILAVI